MDIAKEIGVSDASIIRFARAIGYEGFTDLKKVPIDKYFGMEKKEQEVLTVARGCPFGCP